MILDEIGDGYVKWKTNLQLKFGTSLKSNRKIVEKKVKIDTPNTHIQPLYMLLYLL